MGGKKNAGSRAASAANEANQLGIDELRRQFDLSREDLQGVQEQFQPFVEAGTGALGDLQQGATAGGLEERLAQIFSGESFGALRDERTRAIQGQLGAGGLTRSGTAIESAANIPTELGFAIELF